MFSSTLCIACDFFNSMPESATSLFQVPATSSTIMATTAEPVAMSLSEQMNDQLREYEPTQIMLATAAVTLGVVYALNAARQIGASYQQAQFYSVGELKQKARDRLLAFLQHKPLVGRYIRPSIDKKVLPLLQKIAADTAFEWRKLGPTRPLLPNQPLSIEAILAEVKPASERDHLVKSSGTMYYRPNPEREKMVDEVYSHTKLTNPMHTAEFPKICKMKAEVIAWCQALFHGQVDAANYKFPGMITDGGTSSILEAIRSYARYARETKGILQPEMILPSTAHVAFFNAADACHVRVITVPVNAQTGAADVDAMEKAISKNTCLIVGSAPSFPSGIIDPIVELAAMAEAHGIPVHVDSCLGGFLTAFASDAGFELPLCDFRVKNVMSISVDPHKYGQTPKGSSVLLFHPEAPVSPIYSDLNWEGGMYVAEGLKGSRPGNVTATTWATMLSFGVAGYVEETKRILTFTQKLADAVRAIPGMVLPYPSPLPVITMNTVPGINASLVASKLKESHWHLNMIKSGGFHFCVTAFHEAQQDIILSDFIRDLTAAVEYARQNPDAKPKGLEGVYGQLPDIPDFVQDRVGRSYAAINNSLPPSLCEEVKPEGKRL